MVIIPLPRHESGLTSWLGVSDRLSFHAHLSSPPVKYHLALWFSPGQTSQYQILLEAQDKFTYSGGSSQRRMVSHGSGEGQVSGRVFPGPRALQRLSGSMLPQLTRLWCLPSSLACGPSSSPVSVLRHASLFFFIFCLLQRNLSLDLGSHEQTGGSRQQEST